MRAMWVRSVPYDDAGDDLRASYDRQARALGAPTEVTMAGSLHPALVAARLDLYRATETTPSSLSAHERNLVSYVTSAINRTPHCMSQVTVKLRETGLDDAAIVGLGDDPLGAADRMPAREAAIVRYAARLTADPGAVSEADVDALRAAGLDDLDIVDVNAQCAHLNYVNRVANGLGIHTVVDPDFPAYAAIPTAAGTDR
jgi:uncharacterized peroxidase-related enzyme